MINHDTDGHFRLVTQRVPLYHILWNIKKYCEKYVDVSVKRTARDVDRDLQEKCTKCM